MIYRQKIEEMFESLLKEEGLTKDLFKKKGKPPAGLNLKEKRQSIITKIHQQGASWKDMTQALGISIGMIQNNTQAKGNSLSRQNRSDSAKIIGHSRKGEKKPWLSEQLKREWKSGKFDFHIGRKRSEEEKKRLKEAVTPERRKRQSESKKLLWAIPSYRDKLLSFHRSPEERRKRSKFQAQRILENPSFWSRGVGCYLTSKKCTRTGDFWVRSRYEKYTVNLLDRDPSVESFEYERHVCFDGFSIVPDFIVKYTDGTTRLVEVKADWVLHLPETNKRQIRLQRAREYSFSQGWGFEVWTEKYKLEGVLNARKN